MYVFNKVTIFFT